MLLVRFLNKFVKTGGFILIDAYQTKYIIGNPDKEKPFTMKLLSKDLHWKLLVWPDYYLGLSYMEGKIDFENGNLCDFLELALKNLGRGHSNVFAKVINKINGSWRYLTKFTTIKSAKRNAKHHYDIGDELFSLYLDQKHQQYSCAYFSEGENMSLENAQESMMNHIIKKLNIKKNNHILDLGCGWGGLSIYLAKTLGCRVTGITLSNNQLKAAKEKARQQKIDNLCEFRLEDYRQTKEKFDRIVSKGQAEHVSRKYYGVYFKKIYDLLKPGGISLIHLIGSNNKPKDPNPWISRYIFKNGFCPSMSQLILPIEKSGLVLTDLEILPGYHYSNTLRNWKERFLQNKDKIEKQYDKVFTRMWHFYLSSTQYTFKYGDLVNFQLQLAKETKLVPNTRDYLYQ